MKGFLVLLVLVGSSSAVLAQNEIGPDGDKLGYILLAIVLLIAVFIFTGRSRTSKKSAGRVTISGLGRVKIELEKDSLFYPDKLTMTVKNTGKSDIDLDRPLLVFDNFWIKRKFRLNGNGRYHFYPLYLEKGKIHSLDIDLPRFYHHDKRLRKFPKIKIYLNDVQGKKLGSSSVYIRKTLVNF